jgi:glutaminyl-tRNA synthetase
MGGDEGTDWRSFVNPNSLEICPHAKVEPSLQTQPVGSRFQLERMGYFCVDRDSKTERMVLNRTLTLKDTWARLEKKLSPAR